MVGKTLIVSVEGVGNLTRAFKTLLIEMQDKIGQRMVASAAIAAGVPVFLAANGQIANAGTVKVGESLTAAAALNDVIEVNDR